MANRAGKNRSRPEHERIVRAIASKREKLGLSQRQLSVQLGWHPLTMHRIESLQRGIEAVELVDIASALGEDPIELFRQCIAEIPD